MNFAEKILELRKANDMSQEQLTLTPVSYTHLDVYKRQAWKLPSAG